MVTCTRLVTGLQHPNLMTMIMNCAMCAVLPLLSLSHFEIKSLLLLLLFYLLRIVMDYVHATVHTHPHTHRWLSFQTKTDRKAVATHHSPTFHQIIKGRVGSNAPYYTPPPPPPSLNYLMCDIPVYLFLFSCVLHLSWFSWSNILILCTTHLEQVWYLQHLTQVWWTETAGWGCSSWLPVTLCLFLPGKSTTPAC